MLLALAAVAWLAGNLRSSDRARHAFAAVAERSPASSEAAVAAIVRRDLDAARRFGDDPRLLVREGQLLGLLGRRAEAAGLFAAAARREPENFDAWVLLSTATREDDPVRSERARRRAMELDPQARIARP